MNCQLGLLGEGREHRWGDLKLAACAEPGRSRPRSSLTKNQCKEVMLTDHAQ